MHFGKRLAEFIAKDPRLVCLNYKQLKRLIKAGDFHGFTDTLESEIILIRTSVTEFMEFLELKIALLQKELVDREILVSAETVTNILEYLGVKDDVSLEEAVQTLVNTERLGQVIRREIGDIRDARNGLVEFLEINACGLRKIVKKFRKRANPLDSPKYKHALEAERIRKLLETVDALAALIDVEADSFEPVGDELRMFIDL